MGRFDGDSYDEILKKVGQNSSSRRSRRTAPSRPSRGPAPSRGRAPSRSSGGIGISEAMQSRLDEIGSIKPEAPRSSTARTQRRQQEAASPPAPSLWSQIGSAFTSVPGGLVDLGKGIADAAIGIPRQHRDYAQMASGNQLPQWIGRGGSNVDFSGNLWQDFQATAREYNPLIADMASSVRKTANVTGIGSEENIIARYQTAVEEGRLVSEFLEDAGNVALVAGGTGAVLGRTSRVLSTGAGTNSARVLSQVKKGSRAAPDGSTLYQSGRGVAGRLEGRAPTAARVVGQTGAGARKLSMAADWLDPSTSVFAGVGKLGRQAGRASPLISRAAARVGESTLPGGSKPINEFGSGMRERSRQRAQAREWRAQNEQNITEQQRLGVEAQFNADQALKQAGMKDAAQRDLYGSVVLNVIDGTLDPFLDAYMNPALTPDQQATVLRNYNANPNTVRVTPEIIDTYVEYKSGQMAGQRPDIAAIIDEAIEDLPTQIDNRTTQMVDSGKLLDEQLIEPTAIVQTEASTNRLFQDLTPDERSAAIERGDVADSEFPTTALSKEQLEFARSQGNIKTPFRDTAVTKIRDRMDTERTKLSEQLDEQVEAVKKLEYESGMSEAQLRALPEPGQNVPLADTLEGRRAVETARRAEFEALESQLDDLLESEGLTPEGPIRDQIQEKIAQTAEEMRGIRNAATRAEVDARLSGADKVAELATLPKKKLFEMAMDRQVVGRHRMNKLQLAEALNPNLDPTVRVTADAQIADRQARVAGMKGAAVEGTRISEALDEAAMAVDEATANLNRGVNTTPDGQWDGGPSDNLTQPRDPEFVGERPDADVDPETAFNQEQATFRPEQLDADGNPIPLEAFDGPPPTNTTLGLSPALNLAREAGKFQERLDIARREAWITEQRINSIDRRGANLERDLNTTQQDTLRRVNRQGLKDLKSTIDNDINTGGTPIGEWVPESKKITGVIGELTAKLGNGFTSLMIRRLENMDRQIFQIERDLRTEWSTFDSDTKTKLREKENIWNEQTYVEARSPKAEHEAINPAARAFEDTIEAQGSTVNERLGNDAGRYWEALTQDELKRSIDQANESSSMLAGFAAFSNMRMAISHMPEQMRQFAESATFTAVIDQAEKDFRTKYARQLDTLNDQVTATIPAVFRSPVINARRTIQAVLTEASAQWNLNTPEGRATARALELIVQDTPSSFEAYAATLHQGKQLPQHLIGGDLASRSGKYSPTANSLSTSIETPGMKADQRRRSGSRVQTLREYSNIEAREMTNLMIDQAVKNLADPKSGYSTGLVDVIGPEVAQWFADGRGRLTFYQMRRMAKEKGYVIIEGTTPDDIARRDLHNIPTLQEAMIGPERVDAGGNQRTYAMDGIGRDVEIQGLPDIEDRNWRNGMAEFPDIRVMHNKLAKEVQLFQNPMSNPVLQVTDQITQLWKTKTLAWSPAWVTYNATGNAIMAMFAGGVGPVAGLRNIRAIMRYNQAMNVAQPGLRNWQTRFDTNQATPPRLEQTGLSFAERQSTQQLGNTDTLPGRAVQYMASGDQGARVPKKIPKKYLNPETGNLRTDLTTAELAKVDKIVSETRKARRLSIKGQSIGSVAEHMYQLNSVVDNMGKSVVYLEKLDKTLPEIPKSLLDENGALRTDLNPAEQIELTKLDEKAVKASEDAVKASLNAMGDFTGLTPLERNVFKRVFPFYPWLRHQTRLVYRMPLNNPLRWAFMASLDNIIGQDEDPQGFLEELLAVTPMGINMKPALPFAEGWTGFAARGSESGSVYQTEGVIGAMNPLYKLPFELGLGLNSRGGSLSRPRDQRQTSSWGGQIQQSGAIRLADALKDGKWGDARRAVGELGWQTAGFAAGPALRNYAANVIDPGARWQSGDRILSAQDREDNKIFDAARALRIPFIPMERTSYENLENQARIKDRIAESNRRREEARRISDAARGN